MEGKSPVLITGGAGRLGRALAAAMVQRGWPVRVFDLPEPLGSADLGHQVERVAGDLRVPGEVQRVAEGVGAVVHLAGLLPPHSEQQPDLTRQVNVEGTRRLIDALPAGTRFVFASSVSTYGVPQSLPVDIHHPQQPINVYGETKKEAEAALRSSAHRWTILRVAPIAVPAVLDLPEPWPFTPDQQVEFIALHDVVVAIANASDNDQSHGQTFNIAGGSGWQVTGKVYSDQICRVFELDPAWASFRDAPGWAGWYDTGESQALLDYQRTSLQDHLKQLAAAYQSVIAE